jgi:protein required for attachment to host cells
MPKHKNTWIVMADGSRAVIVQQREIEPGFDVVATLHSEDAHVPAHLIGSERPGRTQESHYSARHAIEPRTDPHATQLTAFLRSLATRLNDDAAAKAFDRLILFAPARALGQLREMLDETTRGKIEAEAAKDLTKTPLDELPKHLAMLGLM